MKQLVLAEAMSTIWAVEPGRGMAMLNVLAARSRGDAATAEDLDRASGIRAGRDARTSAATRMAGGSIAVIPVMGLISQRSNLMQQICGGTSVQQLMAALQEAEADNSIDQIALVFDTPGGSVFGIQEAGAEIKRIAAAKPIVGIADSLCASAGYWLMSQCSECFVTPGGEVGSIGVWQAHEDISKALEMSGEKVTLISAGKFKVEGNPYGPLDPAAKDFMQQRTDEYYRAFTTAVARGRGVGVDAVRNGMGQGRVLGAQDALSQNMVDGVAPLRAVLSDMQRRPRQAGKRGTSAAIRQRVAAIDLAHHQQLSWTSDAARRQREVEIAELEAGIARK